MSNLLRLAQRWVSVNCSSSKIPLTLSKGVIYKVVVEH